MDSQQRTKTVQVFIGGENLYISELVQFKIVLFKDQLHIVTGIIFMNENKVISV